MCKVLGKNFFTYPFKHLVTWILCWLVWNSGQFCNVALSTGSSPAVAVLTSAEGGAWRGRGSGSQAVGSRAYCAVSVYLCRPRHQFLKMLFDSFLTCKTLWWSQTSNQKTKKNSWVSQLDYGGLIKQFFCVYKVSSNITHHYKCAHCHFKFQLCPIFCLSKYQMYYWYNCIPKISQTVLYTNWIPAYVSKGKMEPT